MSYHVQVPFLPRNSEKEASSQTLTALAGGKKGRKRKREQRRERQREKRTDIDMTPKL